MPSLTETRTFPAKQTAPCDVCGKEIHVYQFARWSDASGAFTTQLLVCASCARQIEKTGKMPGAS